MEKLRCTDLDAVVAGRSLKDWYDKVLSYEYGYEYTEGECFRLWAFNKDLDEAIANLSELDEWRDWRELPKQEKEKLKECLVKVISEVWRCSWEVIRLVLSDKPEVLTQCPDWRKGKFSRDIIEEAMLRIDRKGLKEIVKNLVEGENQEWKEWLARKVWLNLAEEMME